MILFRRKAVLLLIYPFIRDAAGDIISHHPYHPQKYKKVGELVTLILLFVIAMIIQHYFAGLRPALLYVTLSGFNVFGSATVLKA
jgi:hypothetical protein